MEPGTATTAIRSPLRDHEGRAEWSERSSRLFEELKRPSRAMLRRAFRGAFSEHEIEDIYAGAWVGVLRALSPRHTSLSDEEVRSYVFTSVAHQAGKELRRRRRKPTAPLDLVGAVPDAGDDPADRAAGAEQSRVARDLLASMPPRRRAVMLLRYGWGLEPRQVCDLVKGLSPRAYRKEITRGVDELTEKMRAFERGEWCADREHVLKAYVAGLADEDQSRQAKAHLSHCRDCSRFVARLSGHLFDLGALAVPVGLQAVGPPAALGAQLSDVGHRVRDAAASAGGRVDELTAQLTAAGGAKGAGAAGGGLVAKLAGLGAGGKLAVACIGSGVAATACIAAGVAPAGDFKPTEHEREPNVRPARHLDDDAVVVTPVPSLPAFAGSDQGSAAGDVNAELRSRPDSRTGEAPPRPEEPIAVDTPPVEQEFGVAPAAVAPAAPDPAASSAGSAGGSGGDSATRQEFGGP
jgi:RNA polymerase sigma factor (sigma-70 family)